MNDTTPEDIHRVELLLNEGDYRNAVELIDTISSKEIQSINDKITLLLLHIKVRIKTGELEKASLIVEEFFKVDRIQDNPLQVIDVLILKSEISWRLGKLDEGLQSVQDGQKLLVNLGEEEEIKAKERKKQLLHHGGILYWYKGDLNQAENYQKQCLIISKEENDKKGVADSFNNLGLIYQSKGEFDLSLEYYQKTMKIYEDLGDKGNLSKTLNNIGIIYSLKGNQERALDFLQRTHDIRVELNDKYDIALSLVNLGVIYRMQGDLTNALEYYQRGQRIYEDINNKKGIALALNNLGDVYQLKGDLNLALEYYLESLSIYEELGINQDIAMSLVNIGELYGTKKNPDWALRYFNRSLAIYEDLKNDHSIVTVLYQLILLSLGCDEPNLAQKHLERIHQIFKRTDNPIIRHRYLIAQALVLKSKKRTRYKMKAEEILAKVVNEEVVDHSLTVTAMIHLCDLLLFELSMTGEDEILLEVKNLTEKLHKIAKDQSSHSLLTEVYVLKSKLALLELDINKAQELLDVALLNAENKGLRTLAIKIYSEKTLLETEIEKWKYLTKRKAPLNERLELTRLEGLMERVTSKRLEVSEDEVDKYRMRVKDFTKANDEIPGRKYQITHLNLLENSTKVNKASFRVGIAQIGISKSGDIVNEFYIEKFGGLLILKEELVETVRSKVKEMVDIAHENEVDILLFPEMSIDLNYKQLLDEIIEKAKKYNMYIIPGSYHDENTKKNISVVIGPNGELWRQEKHIPAIIHYKGRRFKEGIETGRSQRKTIVCNTEYGSIAVVICRDFLDMDLRVELKNTEPPVDLIFNPAFTPVTADFRAAHFDARRSIFAYCFFANIAEVGDSFIFTPERETGERKISPNEESLIYKDVDLFRLRSERKRWEAEHSKERPFIQSTRTG
ncbi:MAG: tetratricopeptide repeat protein [Candidatus Hodarchaeales archaeon]|jgi:tetratricopeptide (TPR) repeat protein/predicted amidohydrolase